MKQHSASVPAGGKEEGETFAALERTNPKELYRIKNEEPERYAKLAADYAAGIGAKA